MDGRKSIVRMSLSPSLSTRHRLRILLPTLALVWAPVVAAQKVTDIPATSDNTLYESSTGALSNGQGSLFVGVTEQELIRRTLLRFDFSGLAIDFSRVDSVTLRLTPTLVAPGAEHIPMSVHVVFRAWGEGASQAPGAGGSGTTAADGDATWIHAIKGQTMWTSPGGDYGDEVSALAVEPGSGAVFSRSSTAFIDLVRGWVEQPATNHGLLILNRNEDTPKQAVRFASRESSTAAERPVLRLHHRNAVTSTEDGPHLPEAVALDPAYPNPFNPSTGIGFRVSEVGHARVAVYDVLGREVAVLVDRVMPAGAHTLSFEAGGLPSGIYFIRLQAAGEVRTRSVTLLK